MLPEILQEIDRAEAENDRQFVTALARGLSILSVFEDNRERLSHQNICDKTGLPKATVSRLIYTLLKTEFLNQDNQGYRLGIAAIQLSTLAWAQYDISRLAKPLMSEFAQEHQVSVSLAIEEAGEMLYLQSIRSPARLAVQLMVGSKVPIAQTAIGRAYFANQTETEQNILQQHLQQKHRQQPHMAQQDWQTLQQHNLYHQQYGFTVSAGEFSNDIIAVAVGVYDRIQNRHTYALNASVPASRWQADDFIRFIAPKLQQLSEQISQL